MKNLFLLAILAVFFVACNSENSSENKESTDATKTEESSSTASTGDKKYEIKEGFVKYKMSMMGMETVTELYFKDHGQVEATITNAEMMGQKMVTKSLQKDGYMYGYSDLTDKGTKIKIDGEGAAASGETPKMDVAAIKAMGGKEIGNEDFLGKSCIVFEMEKDGAKSKFWIWKNLLLKMSASQQGMEVVMEATEVSESPSFPEGVFELPDNIEFTEPNLEADFDVEGAEG